jgi:predicted ATPase/DNA-binding SARP family transcriptional activator
VHIGLLGAVEVRVDGGPVPLRGVRLRGLLARLALDAGRPVGTSVLVDDLWGESPPDGAGNALQALVSRLRRAIGGDLVVTDARGYRLRVAPRDVDALRFDELVTAAGSQPPESAYDLATEALALWRGPALVDVAELPFAGLVAARLGERRAVLVESRARVALRLRRVADELDGLTAQLDAAPLRETTAALLSAGLHAAGRQADALAVADRTIARLADELGVDPGPELAAARLAVLRGETMSAAEPRAATRTVGTGLNSFVGRAGDVERVRRLLTGTRLVTLIGPGGAGKTRLAREAVAGRTAVLAELASLTDGDQLAAAVLAAVGEPELVLRTQDDPAPDSVTRLVTALTARDTLLVLDNCEHLVDAAAALTETLLHAAPRLRVLATSREPLGVPGEVLHPVEALAGPDAVALFADRAAAVRPGFALTADVEPVAAMICRRLDGQPLPIELAAARLRTLTPAEILTRLDDRFRLLTSGARTALPRHQTLRAVVDWSWDLLADPERAVARRLAVFAGGATAAAAEGVCAGPDVDDVFERLASLVDKSLVVAVPQPDGLPTRYRMLETIREYAGERLDEAGEREAAADAHARMVLDLAETAEPHLRTADQLVWLARLRAEADEIDIALRRTVAGGDAATAHRIVAAMVWSWLIRGRTDEADRWTTTVHGLDGQVPAQARALSTGFLAVLSVGKGDAAGARRLAETAVALAAGLPRPWHPVLQLLEPVTTLLVEEDDGPIVALATEAQDPWVRGYALSVRAQIAENEGRIDEQRELLRVAHDQLAAIGDRFGLGLTVHSLGELEDVAGDHAAAARAYDEAIALSAELGNDDDLLQFLGRRALLEARHGDFAAARAMLERIDRPKDGPFISAGGLGSALAQIERMAGDLDAARAHLDIAASDLAGSGFGGLAVPHRRAFLAMTRAAIELAAGHVDEARAAVAEGVSAAVESRDGPVTAAVAEVAAQLALAEGDPRCACLLLGVATAQRGTLDRGSPEVRGTLTTLRASLGTDADALVRAGAELPRADGVARLEAFGTALHSGGTTSAAPC